MALMTADMQTKLVSLLISEGLVSESVLEDVKKAANTTNKPLIALLTERDIVDDELLTHATAQVSGVPYVNLSNSVIDQNILSLLPEDIAEHLEI